jgi:hypothetical protein
MEPVGSLPSPQEAATETHPELDEFSTYPHALFIFNIIQYSHACYLLRLSVFLI